jgi:hypothetical protein
MRRMAIFAVSFKGALGKSFSEAYLIRLNKSAFVKASTDE